MERLELQIMYDNEKNLIESIKNLHKRRNNIIMRNIYSPYPIHNIDKIIKLKETNLSFLSFLYGTLGFILSTTLIWYIMILDWPQNIGGKPSYSWVKNFPSFIPVIFEFTIFFSAHIMCITYLIQCKLFPGSKAKNPDPRTTDNMFMVKIYVENINIKELKIFLKKEGAIKINVINR